MIEISVVIPCHNESDVLPFLYERLSKAADTWNCEYEIICIDDGSNDQTWELLRDISGKDDRWKCLMLTRNFGHQSAVSAGLFHSSGQAVFVLDADLQDPPEILELFIAKWREGYDVVYGQRQKRKEGIFKRSAYWSFYRLLGSISTLEIPLDSGDFCLMSRPVVDTLNAMPEKGRFVRGLRAYAGFRQIGIPYERACRAAGVPQYTISKLMKLALDGLFSFSAFPLKLASHFGFLISAIAVVGIIFTLFQRLFPTAFASVGLEPVPGYATTVILVLFMGGIQMLFLGVIGEYLFRIFEEVKRRPGWIVHKAERIEIKRQPV